MTALAVSVAAIYAFVLVLGLIALRADAWTPWMTAYSYLELGWLLLGIILAGLAFFFDGPITAVGSRPDPGFGAGLHLLQFQSRQFLPID